MKTDFRIMSIDAMCLYLWDLYIQLDKTMHFSFDLCTDLTVAEIWKRPEYLLTIVPCGHLYITTIVRSDEKELKSKVTMCQSDYVKFVKEYCRKHSKRENQRKVFVDFSEWLWRGYDYE